MDKASKHIQKLIKEIKKRRLQENHEYRVDRLILEIDSDRKDEQVDKNVKRMMERKEVVIGPQPAIIVGLCDLCVDERRDLESITDVNNEAVFDAYKEALTKIGRKFAKKNQFVLIFDESEDYPRILYWYHPRNRLWYHDLLQSIRDLRDIDTPKERGFELLGDLWEYI